MKLLRHLLLFALLSAPTLCAPQSPASPHVDAARLARMRARMEAFVAQGRSAGIVALVAHRGEVVSLSAAGWQDVEARVPMKTDSIFQIASMTKPMTCAGIMMLMEDGLLSLGDPVQKFVPEFAGLQVIEPASGGDLPKLRKPARPVRILDLMTHTSGMGGDYPESLGKLFDTRDRTLAEAVPLFPQRGLAFEPGAQWRYSNLGIATLGRIIEIVSGQPYDRFMAARLFQPLDMKDSHFFVPESKRSRIAAIYEYKDNRLAKASVDLFRVGAKYPAPEGGLYSTAEDLFRFYQMMLAGGVYNGQRLLSKASVELMTRNHTGDLKAGFSPGVGFGLGWSVVRNNEGMFRLNSIGTFSHGGLWKTYGFIDPQKELVGVLLMQRLSSDGDNSDELNAFIAMSVAAVVDGN